MTFHELPRKLTMDDVVKTRDGRSARILAVDRSGARSVVALLIGNNCKVQSVHTYHHNGRFSQGCESRLDLIIQVKRDEDVAELVTSSSLATLYGLNDALNDVNTAIISQSFNLASLNSDRDKLSSAIEKSLTDITRISI